MRTYRRFANIIAIVTVVTAGLLGVPPAQGDQVTVVHPTGEFPTDVEAVQAAVDSGGVVILEGTNLSGEPTAFNFGPAGPNGGGVDLHTDVTLVGAGDGPPATIAGGAVPLLGRSESFTRVEGITFEGPLLSAMIFLSSTGAEIVGNHITDVVPLQLISPPLSEGRGIKFLGNNDPAGAITGHILVEDNRIEGGSADLDEGIVFDSVAADVTIRDNVTRNAAGILVIAPGSHVSVTNNDIEPGPGTGSVDDFGNGVLLLGATPDGTYTVSHNRIVCTNPSADALVLAGFDVPLHDVRIERNQIHVESDFAAVSLFSNVDGAVVANNRVTGHASWALGIIPFFGGETAGDVAFVGNSVARFDAALADTVVFSHAHDTILVGNGGDVLDLGVDSRITGSTPMRGGAHIGDQLRDDQEARIEHAATAGQPSRP